MRYTKVPADAEDDNKSSAQHFRATREHSGQSSALYVAIVFALVLSNAMTWVLTAKSRKTAEIGLRSTYGTYNIYMARCQPWLILKAAGLEYDSLELLDAHSPYTDPNITLRDQMWLDIDVDNGMIALTDADVERWGLPASQRFPWDDNKSIYLLQAHHNLHCAVSLPVSSLVFRVI